MPDTNDYERSVRIDASADAIFDAITSVEGLAAWWNPVTGSGETGGELSFDMGAPDPLVMRVDEAIRPTSVAWTATTCSFVPEFVATRPSFSITAIENDVSELLFTHHGMTPALGCFEMIKLSWDHYLDSLRDYLQTGQGSPFGSAADRAWRREAFGQG